LRGSQKQRGRCEKVLAGITRKMNDSASIEV
jgi:hypothetical protein